MKTEFSDSTLGIMRLFNNEEYYKYSVEVFSSLNASALKCGIEYIDEKVVWVIGQTTLIFGLLKRPTQW
mgnify:CR=1 FL=1